MKICCYGAESYINQISRIKEGFLENNCELTNLENADLIYFNDPNSYDLAAKSKNSKAKVIFNFDVEKLKEKLSHCDIVTCICDEVKWQLKNWCGIDAITIYNPIKDVSFLNLTENQKIKNGKGKSYKYLYVGRANDPNKRFKIIYDTMQILGDKPYDLAVVGSEDPGFGDYYGVLEDKDLNLFYNSVEYFFFPSAFKSIGLPALESVVTKTKTIVCDDDPVTREFWPGIGTSSNPEIIAKNILSEEWNNKLIEFNEKTAIIYKEKFDKKNIAKNILSLV
jgi:hypothetical protein